MKILAMNRCLPVWIALVFAAMPATIAFADRPNMVVFLADDLGWTGLKCFGSDFYETPNLDRLASEGMKFADAYAACTVCSPTRASIMTGLYPGRLQLTSFIAGQNRRFAKMSIPDWTKGLKKEYTTTLPRTFCCAAARDPLTRAVYVSRGS